MTEVQKTVSPVDGSVCAERRLVSPGELDALLARAQSAQRDWRAVGVHERVRVLGRLVGEVLARRDELVRELALQMGRPVAHGPGELGGFEERARAMLAMAPDALVDLELHPKTGFHRFMRREPLGVVLVLAPWNYPWLTAVNAVIPALAAGNAVVLKHSDQTPLVSERFVEAATAAGLPEGVFQYAHLSHERVAAAVRDPRVSFVSFTGSVEGGRAVHRAAADRFIGVALELGGKDAAYVRADADLEPTVAGVVDGAFFNAGQSCCAIERVYVQEPLYERFVEAAAAAVGKYVLGDPREPSTTLGPVVRVRNARAIQAQVEAALAAGARAVVDAAAFGSHELPYLPPQLLVGVTHDMDVMREETFGPVLGVMKVRDDEEAVARMNDSRYGLTASIWTSDLDRALSLGDRLEVGTVFMNRADYLDPELAWVGVRDSGRGVSLSRLAYEHLTRPKSFHLRERST